MTTDLRDFLALLSAILTFAGVYTGLVGVGLKWAWPETRRRQ